MRKAFFFFAILAWQSAAQIPQFSGAGLAGGPPVGLQRGTSTRGLLTVTPFFSATGTYSTGMGRVSLLPDGTVPEYSGASAAAVAGVSGAHAWRRSLLGIYYGANYSHTFENQNLSGLSQTLSLAFTREIGRRTYFGVVATGTMANRAFGLAGAGGLATLDTTGLDFVDPFSSYSLQHELLDARSYSSGLSAGISHGIGRNWMVSASGSAFLGYRKVRGLPTAISNSSQGAIARRLSRRASMVMSYSHMQFRYDRGFGDVNGHQGMAGVAYRVDEHSSLVVMGGVLRSERIALTRVTLPPEIAAILGVSFGQEVFYGDNLYGAGSAHFHRKLRRASFGATYSLSMVPGNGFYVASRSHSGDVTYNRTAFRRWSVTASAGANRYAALMQNLKPLQTYHVSGAIGRQVGSYWHVSFTGGFRHIEAGNRSFARDTAFASVSVAFGPPGIHVPGWW